MLSEPIQAETEPDIRRTGEGVGVAANEVVGIDVEDNAPKQRSKGSKRRRRQAAAVVGLALLSAGAGVLVGTRLKSPSDAASQRAAPTASLITVPVEKRKLESTLTVAGEIQYVEPTPVRLAGAVGGSGETQVVTRLPTIDADVAEGGVLLEVSGRPVFAMRGELPMYRQLVPGATGPDVTQLETSLEKLGFSPGTVDNIYDAGTEAALDAFYESHGYVSEGASETQRKDLAAARKAVSDADEAVRRAKNDLATGSSTVSASERLAKQQSVARATSAVPAAQAQAARDDEEAAQQTATATASRDNLKASRDVAKVRFDEASKCVAEGGVDCDDPNSLQSELLAKEQELIQAEQTLATAIATQTDTAQRGQAAIKDAQDALALARLELNDLDKPRDTTTLTDAVNAANEQADASRVSLAEMEAAVGTVVPAGEVVFLPVLPTTVTEVAATLGAAPPTDQLALVSSTNTQITGRIAKVDGDLVTVGAVVDIQVPDAGIDTTGTVTDVRKPVTSTTPNDNPFGGSSGDTSDRLEVVVVADDSTRINQFIGFSVRIKVTVSATDSEVLAVPVAALSVGPDGVSRVEVEREAARGTRPGRTELVDVTVGLSAQGYAEIGPLGDTPILEGDRVVIGSDTGERKNRRERTTTSTTVSADG
jgi:peptidoglycan hydrolase-like protein with peptidoglycan-binding domain